jgi:Domain of unknown function (DUF3883)
VQKSKCKREVTCVSANRPNDLHCEKKGGCKKVEVKGTQGRGLEFVLTRREVEFINGNKSNYILCLVHGIKVQGPKTPKVTGGRFQLKELFDLSDGKLVPIVFTFSRNQA